MQGLLWRVQRADQREAAALTVECQDAGDLLVLLTGQLEVAVHLEVVGHANPILLNRHLRLGEQVRIRTSSRQATQTRRPVSAGSRLQGHWLELIVRCSS